MQPLHSLPLSSEFSDPEEYVNSLLSFSTSSELFQRLCGGVHILDFFTREPNLYSSILPNEWRKWFEIYDISDILDFLLREDINLVDKSLSLSGSKPQSHDGYQQKASQCRTWRYNHPLPPTSLLEYIHNIRKHTLDRHRRKSEKKGAEYISFEPKISRLVSVGMKPKKIHEVANFAKYIDNLSSDIGVTSSSEITHFVDFGSGQNYLGRTLASAPYNKSVVAIESRFHNIDGAKNMDITAKLAKKKVILRNKKQHRDRTHQGCPRAADDAVRLLDLIDKQNPSSVPSSTNQPIDEQGMHYFEHEIQDGDLSMLSPKLPKNARLMVISLHSCGNLSHHGLRSLVANNSVKAVALVGCCYNLVSERLGPPTYKLPNMRSLNLRLNRTSSQCDPDGFPMSRRLTDFKHGLNQGIRCNITARMMAVQAPRNWTPAECASFFTRHFYRALLQRIFLDYGLVDKPTEAPTIADISPRGRTGLGEPILIGSLPKACYVSFEAYVYGVIEKLNDASERGRSIVTRLKGITSQDISKYEETFKYGKKELSILWSLMAVSAEVVESMIVVDRWLYLKEQTEVEKCWVEAVFDYKQSPRNLVVVGIKR